MKFEIIQVTYLKQNCTIIWDENTLDGVVVDPGGKSKKIIQKIKHYAINIKYILLTHGHFDHISDAMKISKYFSIPIIGPNIEDKFLFENFSLQSNVISNNIKNFNFYPNLWLNDNDVITFGTIKFNVLHCPGHTPGHVIFVNHKDKIISIGDVLFHKSIGRTDLPRGNFITLINSIRKKIFVLDDDYKFIPGHGKISTLGIEKKYNPFFKKN
ncbi:MAG: MBL fold metallo-hydrolase [Arsenophonus sp.]|nr:MAG: MBL fold metallo-hydrolase [Arsenophonus sp.]